MSPRKRQTSLGNNPRQGQSVPGIYSHGLLDHRLQIHTVLRLPQLHRPTHFPLFTLGVKLLPQPVHHARTLDQMIHHRPQRDRRRIAAPAYARHNVKAYVVVGEILRRRRVHGVQHANEMMLGVAEPLLGAFGRDGRVHELGEVAEAVGAFGREQGDEPENGGMQFGIDADDSAVAGVALHGCHKAGYVAAGAEEAEGFAELGGELISQSIGFFVYGLRRDFFGRGGPTAMVPMASRA